MTLPQPDASSGTRISPRDLPAQSDLATLDWNITIRREVGEVLAANRTQTLHTTTTTSGGGGSIYNGQGRIDPVTTSTSTSTTNKDSLFLRLNDGTEKRLSLTDAPDIWRTGSMLAISYACRDGRERRVALRNLDTGEGIDFSERAEVLLTRSERYDFAKGHMHKKMLVWLLISLFVAAFLAGWLGFVLALISLLTIYITSMDRAGKKLAADISALT
ncbi:hypothetical protein [Celeribacter sp. SCSIO 80788]|jgi:hypothetical protein|uniref:hypothetical protein n=1 Tax=Celeribacter sp. SCSIO 80788 TaxID=3117013 RepID=UPI003DA67945